MNINIPISDILTEVRKTTQYIGTHTHMQTKEGMSGNVYESVGAIEENEEILLRFLCESVTEIRVKDIEVVNVDDVPNSVKAPDVTEENLRPYLIYAVVYKWLLLGNVVNDRVPLYKQLSSLYLGNVRSKAIQANSGDDVIGDNGIGSTYGTEVEEYEGDTDGDDVIGKNDIGDKIDGTEVDEYDDEDSDDVVGKNNVGDEVESFIVDDADGDDDEPTGCNTIGDDTPQNFGDQMLVIHRYNSK